MAEFPENTAATPGDEPPESLTSDERLWAILAHASQFLAPVITPLIIWLVKKDESRFVEDQAREALNFQLTAWIIAALCGVTCVLVPLGVVVLIGAAVFSVLATIESSKGIRYRYRYTIRLIT